MGTGAEVADRSVPDAHQAPVAGIADIDDADVAFDLPAAAVDRRPVGVADENLAVAHDLFDHRDMAERHAARAGERHYRPRSEEHTSELQSLMRISYAVFCLQKTKPTHRHKP